MIKITLRSIQKQIDKKREKSINIDTISMNNATWKYLNKKYYSARDYINLTLPCTIFGLNVKIEDRLKDNEVYIYDSNTTSSYEHVQKAVKDIKEHEDKLWEELYRKKVKDKIINPDYTKTTMNMTFQLDNGEIRLELLDSLKSVMEEKRQILPIIRLEPITLSVQSLSDVDDVNGYILRNVYLALKKFEEELRSKI